MNLLNVIKSVPVPETLNFAKSLKKRAHRKSIASALYAKTVEQARDPELYQSLGVADTVDGRFDMVVLHAYLFIERLQGDKDVGQDIAQNYFDVMFKSMDDALREMGVGDLSVGRKVQKMAEAFYGRSESYNEAFAEEKTDPDALVKALTRNVYRSADRLHPSQAAALAAYVRRQKSFLSQQSISDFAQGRLQFAPVLHEA